MDINRILPIIIGISIAGMVLLIGILVKSSQSASHKNMSVERQTPMQLFLERFYQRAYIVLGRFLLTRKLTKDIRIRMEIVHNDSEKFVRKRVVLLSLQIYIGLLVIWLVFALFSKELYLFILFVCLSFMLSEVVVDFLVVRLRNQLLNQNIHFNEQLRQKYYEFKTIDEAIYEVCHSDYGGRAQNYMTVQGLKILEILTSKDVENEIEKYYEVAPNNYLKMLMGLCYLTMEYGDSEVDHQSVFMKNLSYLSDEIRMEVTKREQLNYALKSLNGIVLLPLFFIGPIKQWAGKSFRPLAVFYESPKGFLFESLMIALVVISFIALRKVQQFDERKTTGFVGKPWELKVFNEQWLKILRPFMPSDESPKGRAKTVWLRQQGKVITYELYYIRKWLIGFTFFLIGMAVIGGMHVVAYQNIWTKPTMEASFLGGQLSEEDQVLAMEKTQFDNGWLRQSVSENPEKLSKALETSLQVESAEAQIIAQRIYDKKMKLNNLYLKWYELILAMALGGIGYYVLDIWMIFQERIRKMEMADEVAGFQTIILMLMHHQRVSVIELLEWMELFSFAFKGSIQTCLNDASHGLELALLKLQEKTDYEPFKRLVEQLHMAADELSIEQAFDELEAEKHYHLQIRKTANERLVAKKIALGQTIGFLPVYGLIILYMIVPMLTSSISEMDAYFKKLY